MSISSPPKVGSDSVANQAYERAPVDGEKGHGGPDAPRSTMSCIRSLGMPSAPAVECVGGLVAVAGKRNLRAGGL